MIKDILVVQDVDVKAEKRKRRQLLKWRYISDSEDDEFIVKNQAKKKKLSFSKCNSNNIGDKSSDEEPSSAKRRNLGRRASFASQLLPVKKMKEKACIQKIKGRNSKAENDFLFPCADSCD